MDLNRYDVMMFLYNYGVVLSGAYIALGFETSADPFVLGFGAVAALVWTIYFRSSLLPRFLEHPALDPDEDFQESGHPDRPR